MQNGYRHEVSAWAEREILFWLSNFPNNIEELIDNLVDRRLTVFRLDISNFRAKLHHKPFAHPVHVARAVAYERFLNKVANDYNIPNCCMALEVDDEGADQAALPVFTFQKISGSRNVLLPDVDFVQNAFYSGFESDKVSFIEKRHSAIFVGSTTGAGNITHEKLDDNSVPRIRLARRFRGDAEGVVIRLPNLVQLDSPSVEARLLEEGFGGSRVAWVDQLNHRFLISIDGNGAPCSRPFLSLSSNCALVKYRSDNVLHYYHALEAGKHFFEIEDEDEILDILAKKPEESEVVAREGRRFAETYLSVEMLSLYAAELLKRYATNDQFESSGRSTGRVHIRNPGFRLRRLWPVASRRLGIFAHWRRIRRNP